MIHDPARQALTQFHHRFFDQEVRFNSSGDERETKGSVSIFVQSVGAY